MRMKALSLSLVAGLSMVSVAAIAEPAVQAGETLESLSKAKVTTTVNGQPGSIKELVESGKIKLISPEQSQPTATQPLTPAQPPVPAASDATAPVAPTSLTAPDTAPSAPAAMPETTPPNVAQPNAQLDAPEAEQLLSQ